MERQFNIDKMLAKCSFATLLGLFSCVNNEYDLNELNTEVTIAQNGISLPIGKTEKMKINDLITDLDNDILTQISGAYALKMSETIDFSNDLPNLNEMLKIEDIKFNDSFRYDVNGLDATNATISALDINTKIDAGNELNTEINLQQLSHDSKTALGLYDYASKIKDFDLKKGFTDQFIVTSAKFVLPSLSITGDYKFPTISETLKTKTTNVDLELTSPDSNIENIRDIILENTSKMKISVEVSGHEFLKSGDIIPNIIIDCGRLFSINNSGTTNKSNILITGILNKSNQFKTSHDCTIASINIKESDWNGSSLSLHNPMNISGSLKLQNCSTDRATLTNYINKGGTGEIKLRVDISFGNITIKSATLDLKELIIEENAEIPISLGDGITIPEQIKSLDNIIFTNNSVMTMSLKPENLNISNLKADVSAMTMKFPTNVKVKNVTNGIINIAPFNLKVGTTQSFNIEKIDIPTSASTSGTLKWNDVISINSTIKVSGKGINSADLPASPTYDSAIRTTAKSTLEIEEWNATTNNYSSTFTPITEQFSQDIVGEISEFGVFTITPEGSPQIVINVEKPLRPEFRPGSEGIKITLPEFLRFKNIDPVYNYNEATHSLSLKSHIPETIFLPIDKLVINPQPKPNGYELIGKLTVSGGIAINQGTISSKDVENIATDGINFKISIPEIKASKVEVDEFIINIDEHFKTTLIKGAELPTEIISISEAKLKDVYANLGMKFTGVPNLGAGKNLEVNVKLTIPDEIILDETDNRVNGNTLTVNGIIKNNSFNIPPVKIKEIDLSNYDFNKKPDLTGTVNIVGNLSANNPQLDLSGQLEPIVTKINLSIANIRFDRVIGKLDYVLDPTNENIQLTDIPDILKDETACLDIDNPYILLKAKTNLGIPMKGDLSIVPVRNGIEAKDENISLNISMKGSPSAAKKDSSMYFIAAKNEGCPADYQFIKAENIKEIIKKIPDELRLSFNARTSTETECIVEPQAKYTFDVDYSLVAPLSFGKDLNIEMSDTLTGFDDIVPELLNNNIMQLGGEVINALPLQLDLKIQLLDNNDKIIHINTPATQVIKACSSDGSPTTAPLDMTIDVGKKTNLTNFKGLLLTFKATSGNVVGVPVTEESFVQAKVTLKLPEGITMDLEDFQETTK